VILLRVVFGVLHVVHLSSDTALLPNSLNLVTFVKLSEFSSNFVRHLLDQNLLIVENESV